MSLGAVLAQKKEGGRVHPVQYASRTMTPAERNYSEGEREALAIVFALMKFRVYLLSSRPFSQIPTIRGCSMHARRRMYMGEWHSGRTSARNTSSRLSPAPDQTMVQRTTSRALNTFLKTGLK